MNLAAFAVIVARERETDAGDDMSSLYGLGADRPWLAWPMTIAMLSLAGFPATAGFFGKLYLIEAAVDNEYAWLGVAIVLGSAISLVYYLRVVAAVWMRSPSEAVAAPARRRPARGPSIAGGSPEADAGPDAGARRRRAAPATRSRRRGGVAARPAAPPARQPEVVFVALVCAVPGRARRLPGPAARRRPRRGRGAHLAGLAPAAGATALQGVRVRGRGGGLLAVAGRPHRTDLGAVA